MHLKVSGREFVLLFQYERELEALVRGLSGLRLCDTTLGPWQFFVRSLVSTAVHDVCPVLALLAFGKDACSSFYLRFGRGRRLVRRRGASFCPL